MQIENKNRGILFPLKLKNSMDDSIRISRSVLDYC